MWVVLYSVTDPPRVCERILAVPFEILRPLKFAQAPAEHHLDLVAVGLLLCRIEVGDSPLHIALPHKFLRGNHEVSVLGLALLEASASLSWPFHERHNSQATIQIPAMKTATTASVPVRSLCHWAR